MVYSHSVVKNLQELGLEHIGAIVRNPSYADLFSEETNTDLMSWEQGHLTNLGAVAVDTGIFTGRSPKDKYIVRDATTQNTVWWSDQGKGKNDNHPIDQVQWRHFKGLIARQLSGKKLFVIDAWCGANPETRLSVRFVTEVAWQAHFVKNMFIRPDEVY